MSITKLLNCFYRIVVLALIFAALFSNLTSSLLSDHLTNYHIKYFDPNNGVCVDVMNFEYKWKSQLRLIHMDQDNDGLFDDAGDDDDNNDDQDQTKRLVAVKDDNILILLKFRANNYKEYVIKKFETNIIQIEPKWYFERLYVVTKQDEQNRIEIYEVDLLYQVFTLVTSFIPKFNSSNILITSDPFQGSITYSVDNEIHVFNILYLNLPNQYLKSLKHNVSFEYKQVSYEHLFNESATCKRHGFFEFIITSSELSGYTQTQTYYVKNKSKKLSEIKCSVYKNDCSCIPIKSSESREAFKNLISYYNMSTCPNKILTENVTNIEVLNKRSNFNRTIHDLSLKSCLRICPIAEWQKELRKISNSNSFKSGHELPCTNKLSLSSTLDQFGIALINQDDSIDFSIIRILVHFYDEFLVELLSSDCYGLEMMYKYSVNYRQLKNTGSINFSEEENYEFEKCKISKESSIDSTINLTLSSFHSYEIKVNIQTPFDANVYNVGNFIINKNLPLNTEFIEPNYMKMIVKEIPYIYANYWSEYIANTFIFISFYKEFHSENNFQFMFYCLTDLNTNHSIVKNINETGQIVVSDSQFNNKFKQIVFKIANLSENNQYRLRLIDKTVKEEVNSLSNMISFKTLRRPWIKILNVHHDSIDLGVFLSCKSEIVDHDLNTPYSFIENGCNLFKIYIQENNNESSSYNKWQVKYERFIDEKDINCTKYANTNNTDIIYKQIKLRNLSSNANYSIKLEVELYLLYFDSASRSNILASNIFEFKTSENLTNEESELKISKFTIILITFILIALFIVLVGYFISRLIINVYKKLKSRNKYIDSFESNSAKLNGIEATELLDKMSVNLLYARNKVNSLKNLIEDINNIPKINENQVIFIKKIGNGAFGDVYKGLFEQIDNKKIYVAIKKLKAEANETEKMDLIKEAMSLNSLNHPNLLNLYGICIDKNFNPKFIILEYMNMGDLLTYLRYSRNRSSEKLKYKESIKICLEIAKGCAYLEKQQLVHRDIAARNCLINKKESQSSRSSKKSKDSNITVKIGDFGLAREIYSNDYYKQSNNQKPLPIRWMAPEAIIDGIFTTKSDVWSFGVLVWEVVTLGFQPYPGLENNQVIDYIKNGSILQVSDRCPQELQSLMHKCWNIDYQKRASFEQLVKDIESIYSDKDGLVSNADILPLDSFLNDEYSRKQSKQYNYDTSTKYSISYKSISRDPSRNNLNQMTSFI